jgi:hypothetical protein
MAASFLIFPTEEYIGMLLFPVTGIGNVIINAE